ncbi:hypothetical protein KUTeg_006135 [Tegillarca granosa]|uniref:Cyclin-dependent kinases regulatory subunit n=1 Tax=Tegillarca granosa TaxID=220873 RepID=A0ABQ9FIW6_TEGGR|nr:hypothetical protein KUTeg_006135 [Tegillarca granosa]
MYLKIFQYDLERSLSKFLDFLWSRHGRHVILPPDIAKLVPKNHLMTETEWRNIGVQQSPGWVHYMVHTPGLGKLDQHHQYKIIV